MVPTWKGLLSPVGPGDVGFLGFCPGVSCPWVCGGGGHIPSSVFSLFFWLFGLFLFCFLSSLHPVSQGVLEEQLTLSGDGAYNAHFGESIASLGDLDDDGFPGQ